MNKSEGLMNNYEDEEDLADAVLAKAMALMCGAEKRIVASAKMPGGG